MIVTELGILMLVKLRHRLKAALPMVVTELGILILVKLLQFEKYFHQWSLRSWGY